MWITRTATVLVFLLLALSTCMGANTTSTAPKNKLKILAVFAHLGKSHFDVFKPLLEELARRGHEVTVISHFPRSEKADPLPTYKDISMRDEKLGIYVNIVDLSMIGDSYIRMFYELGFLYMMSSTACEITLKNPSVQQLMASDEKFDVVLVESFNTDCFMAIVQKFKVPFIQISTHQLMPWAVDVLGLSHEASYIPAMFTRLPRPMNFLERVTNVFQISIASLVYDTVFKWRDRRIASEAFGPGVSDLGSVARNASLMMVNTHYTVHGSISFPPNVVEVGGIHITQKVKPLPPHLKQFLDSAHEGVLYFNLGSMVKMASMPKDKLEAFIKVLGSIPRKVICKWEIDDMPNLPSNVMVQKWLPQYDILNHPNVKCFFAHGGLLGLTEGIQSGVPMIVMPLFGDQYQNAIAAQARGVAIVVSYTNLNEKTLRHAVDEIFNNTSYQRNAKRLAKAFLDRPKTPMETGVWWVEYVGRGNGVPYLRSDGSWMPWYQRNLVDVGIFFVLVSLAIVYASYKILKLILAKVWKSKEMKKGDLSKKKN